MKKVCLFIVFFFCLFLTSFSFFKLDVAHSAPAAHVVISEIQIASASANDEFVELYNPTSTPVNITGWRLGRKTQTGSANNLVLSISGTIPAKGFFLITPQTGYTGTTTADQLYSVTTGLLAADNTVLLYSDAGVTLVDKVGMGLATDIEASSAAVPGAGKSIERKAKSDSTITSMTTGTDVGFGNSEDTDNNSTDFIVRDTSQPQNSQSASESLPQDTPTPTETPSPTPTNTPTPTDTPSPTPTQTPSPTPTDTPMPTNKPTPTETSTPTPTETPSQTPTPAVEDTPTTTPTQTPTISQDQSPTNTPAPTKSSEDEKHHHDRDNDHIHHFPRFEFKIEKRDFHFGRKKFSVPFIHCTVHFRD